MSKVKIGKKLAEYFDQRGIPYYIAFLYGIKASQKGIRIPVRDPWGVHIVTITRRWDGESPKYLLPKGSNPRIYPFGLDVSKRAAHEKGYLVITEGPFDVLSLTAAGIPAVGMLGGRLTKGQAFWISRYVDRALLAFDRGAVERRNAAEAARLLENLGVWTKALDLLEPLGDLGEAWNKLRYPRAQLREWVGDATAQLIR